MKLLLNNIRLEAMILTRDCYQIFDFQFLNGSCNCNSLSQIE